MSKRQRLGTLREWFLLICSKRRRLPWRLWYYYACIHEFGLKKSKKAKVIFNQQSKAKFIGGLTRSTSRYKATIEDFTENGYLIKYDDFEDKEEVSSKTWLVVQLVG